MKTVTFAFALIIAVLQLHAQNFLISFAGTGGTLSVDSVKVENLSQCTTLIMGGSDTLHLTGTVGVDENRNHSSDLLTIYPNPAAGSFLAGIDVLSEGVLQIGLYNLAGEEVLKIKKYLHEGHHSFQLRGIHEGIYILKVESDEGMGYAKLISTGLATVSPEIQYLGSELSQVVMKTPQAAGSIITMQFNAGDTLKLTGRSGNYRTVSMLFPAASQTVTFEFAACTDADSNHYAMVRIGQQLWMQENLKATKYRDGSAIPNVTDSAQWGGLTTGAWCDYHNLPEEGAFYGHLYNYYAVADSRNVCPVGWHVPSNGEWNIMEKLLDNTVDTTALGGTGTVIGRILKEGCNTRWQYLDTTYGFNSAGFTALCTNSRTATGGWSLAPGNNHDDAFWTSTSYNASAAWFRSFRWCFSDIYSLFPMKKGGNSVRCMKDN